MKKRSVDAQKRHAESMIKIGESIHSSTILTVLVAPSIYLSNVLLENKIIGLKGVVDFALSNYLVIYFLLGLLTVSAFVGSKFKDIGYDIIDKLSNIQ